MSNLITTSFNPEWADQKICAGGNGATVGCSDDTAAVNKISRNIHFDWMNNPKAPVITHHLEPGQHIKVKPREDVRRGNQRFLDLCKKMGLHPSTCKNANK